MSKRYEESTKLVEKNKKYSINEALEIQDELIGSDFMPIEKNEEVVLTCGSAKIYEMPEN